jgi:hypothetical protein
MDTAQILLLIVVVILTVLLVALGVQVFFILREFKNTVAKLNKVLDDAGTITESVSTPIASLSTVLTGVKTGLSIAKMFKKKSARQSTGKKEEETDGQQ